MAHHSATKKSIRQIAKRNERNRALRSTIRTACKKVEAFIESKEKANANTALKSAQSLLDGGVSKGIVKRNTASRKLSRLNAAIKNL